MTKEKLIKALKDDEDCDCEDCNLMAEFFGEESKIIEEDNVNHPSHYTQGGVETIEIIKEVLPPEQFRGYLLGTFIKYRERHPYKGKSEEDLAKAKFFWDRLQEEKSL